MRTEIQNSTKRLKWFCKLSIVTEDSSLCSCCLTQNWIILLKLERIMVCWRRRRAESVFLNGIQTPHTLSTNLFSLKQILENMIVTKISHSFVYGLYTQQCFIERRKYFQTLFYVILTLWSESFLLCISDCVNGIEIKQRLTSNRDD